MNQKTQAKKKKKQSTNLSDFDLKQIAKKEDSINNNKIIRKNDY